MEFSSQKYWRGLPCPPLWDLPNPWIEIGSLMSPALAGRFSYTRATWEGPQVLLCVLSHSLNLTLCDPMDCSSPGSSVPEDSQGKNTGVGCHALLQGIFPTQGSNPSLLHCRQILYCLSHQGCPRMQEWVAYSFSRRSSWSRIRTGVSWIAGWFFTRWGTREDPSFITSMLYSSMYDWTNHSSFLYFFLF